MKTYKNLYTKFNSFENLLLAYKKAYKATKTAQSFKFMFNLENEILNLQQDLLRLTYKPQAYHYFTIYEPKEREISVACFRDRVVHHALVNVLEPIYEKLFIDKSFATRKNKGTHAAIKQAQLYLRKNNYFLKCDIRKYFYSINHETLIELIKVKIADKKLLQIIERIIKNAGNDVGLPIGNLTSQFFANVYLNSFDHFVKRGLKQQYYLRYMDDFVFFSNDKEELKVVLKEIEVFLLDNLQLNLKEKATLLNTAMHGLSFLGTRIFRKTIRVKQQNLKRSLKKIRHRYYLFKQGHITEEEFILTANSIFAHLRNYNTRNFLKGLPFIDKEILYITIRKYPTY